MKGGKSRTSGYKLSVGNWENLARPVCSNSPSSSSPWGIGSAPLTGDISNREPDMCHQGNWWYRQKQQLCRGPSFQPSSFQSIYGAECTYVVIDSIRTCPPLTRPVLGSTVRKGEEEGH